MGSRIAVLFFRCRTTVLRYGEYRSPNERKSAKMQEDGLQVDARFTRAHGMGISQVPIPMQEGSA